MFGSIFGSTLEFHHVMLIDPGITGKVGPSKDGCNVPSVDGSFATSSALRLDRGDAIVLAFDL